MSLTYGFALNASDNSADFSGALNAVTGDGITTQGGKLAAAVNGFNINLSSGYALAAGRYLQNDETHTIEVGPPLNSKDRVDALTVCVDYEARKAELKVLEDVNIAKIRADPSIIRNEDQYCIILYLISVKRGATSLTTSDITDLRADKDLCGSVVPLPDIAGDVIYIYNFLNGGIDAEVSRLIGLSNAVIAKADAAIADLDSAIKAAGGGANIGDLFTGINAPSESGWLLCNGGAVPAGYTALSALLDGTLPDISKETDRYKTYIFGGALTEV